ncbi:hypothetical protein FISHEDRAFT_52740 [Fistulina hepatica ATCC 64428]|nr:hypothetical protein FISHEDRAFT_52740 [Fistulina hepatica ATCC 64428]
MSPPQRLCTLAEWSIQHIRDIFEAKDDAHAMGSIEATFAPHMSGSINGTPLTRPLLTKLVLALRQSSPHGLKVQWTEAVGISEDPSTNRNGLLGGSYVIRGIQKTPPGSARPAAYERHKSVQVRIESQKKDTRVDSRRIVSLSFVASDICVAQ